MIHGSISAYGKCALHIWKDFMKTNTKLKGIVVFMCFF